MRANWRHAPLNLKAATLDLYKADWNAAPKTYLARRGLSRSYMWIRKSEEDIRLVLENKERRRKDLLRPLAAATAMAAISTLLYRAGVWSLFQGVIVISPAPAEFGITTMIAGTGLFVIIFAIAVYQQRKNGGLFQGETWLLCVDCKQPCRPNRAFRCSCGGQLEPFELFDWASDAKAPDSAGIENQPCGES